MIADFHNDYLTNKSRKEIISLYGDGTNKIVGAIFRCGRDYVYAKSTLNFFLKHKTDNLFFAFEDFSYEEDLPNLIYGLLDYKPVYVGLTWNGENNLAHGAGCDGKLKPRAKVIIKELNKRNIFIDCAHLSESSFYDLLNYTDNILCSHTCFYDVTPHVRNLKRLQIKKIIERDGLIGLTLYAPFLTKSGKATIADVITHIDYFCENFGVNNLAIGTDFYGCDNLPEGFHDYSFQEYLASELLNRGYKHEQVQAILFGNLNRFLIKRGT